MRWLTPRDLRDLIDAGVSIEAVRRRLGHASAGTTQLYALLDDKVAHACDNSPRARARRRAPGQAGIRPLQHPPTASGVAGPQE
ncbi:site-specific integrase [Nonomuraea basaltis]|uniref:site-specific integrase n=1 Tax=Nonomuraea basaltis TaxID=2495887 RepID=UPI00197D0419|nr:site-specific integrase [Nonomuraea basaltis]